MFVVKKVSSVTSTSSVALSLGMPRDAKQKQRNGGQGRVGYETHKRQIFSSKPGQNFSVISPAFLQGEAGVGVHRIWEHLTLWPCPQRLLATWLKHDWIDWQIASGSNFRLLQLV